MEAERRPATFASIGSSIQLSIRHPLRVRLQPGAAGRRTAVRCRSGARRSGGRAGAPGRDRRHVQARRYRRRRPAASGAGHRRRSSAPGPACRARGSPPWDGNGRRPRRRRRAGPRGGRQLPLRDGSATRPGRPAGGSGSWLPSTQIHLDSAGMAAKRSASLGRHAPGGAAVVEAVAERDHRGGRGARRAAAASRSSVARVS